MNLLLDTHLLLWAAGHPDRLSAPASRMLSDGRNTVHFSVVSLWDIAIKRTLGRHDFQVDARQLRRGLLEHGYSELPLNGPHAVSIDRLPNLHKDPFDRMLISQAEAEGFVLLTADRELGAYGGCVRLV